MYHCALINKNFSVVDKDFEMKLVLKNNMRKGLVHNFRSKLEEIIACCFWLANEHINAQDSNIYKQ